ncbi:MAG TPA: hypothetical protein VK911_07015 [Vicinamibacterales bacterium]|nr:hypothetical protein [Vicinamibacterales bacterium]
MHRFVTSAAIVVFTSQALLSGQGKDAGQVLADARAAVGGDKLASVRTLTGQGRTLRTNAAGNTTESEFEVALELPDKYRLRTALAPMGNMTVYRHTGFNGDRIIEEVDRPPNLSGGVVHIRIAGPGGTDPEKMTPEQKAEADRLRLLATRKEFARLVLGLFPGSPDAYPLQFSYAGEAEAPDGKADVLDVTGEGGFAARLFVDAATHLPLMLTWMDKEPLVVRMGPGGANVTAGGGGAVFQRIERAAPMSKEEREKMEKDMEAARAEAEATRRTVEFRLYYGDYREVGGVRLPHRIQRAVDGQTTEEMEFDSLKVNAKIDRHTFEPSR